MCLSAVSICNGSDDWQTFLMPFFPYHSEIRVEHVYR